MTPSPLSALAAHLRRAPILAEAWLSLIGARALLALAPIDRLLTGEQRPGDRDRRDGAPSDPRAIAVAQALPSAARRLPGTSTCLARALAGRWMLSRRGIGAVVHLGMRREAAGLTAHAWLEAGGGVVSGGADKGDFTPIIRIGAL